MRIVVRMRVLRILERNENGNGNGNDGSAQVPSDNKNQRHLQMARDEVDSHEAASLALLDSAQFLKMSVRPLGTD